MNKRVLRDFTQNVLRYMCYIMLISIATMVVVGFYRAMDSIEKTMDQMHTDSKIEDGYFILPNELSEDHLKEIENLGYIIQRIRYYDYDVDKDVQLRIIESNDKINILNLIDGNGLTVGKNEIVLDQHYTSYYNIILNDLVNINDNELKVVGIGITPDYVSVKKLNSDMLHNPKSFGVGYVSNKVFDSILNKSGYYVNRYSFIRINKKNMNDLKIFINENYEVAEWMENEDNTRITGIFSNVEGPKMLAVTMGILAITLIGFMISVQQIQNLKQEKKVIGVLYSLGYKKRELLFQYLQLPIFLTILGTFIGFGLGILISKPLLILESSKYNLPIIKLQTGRELYLLGGVLPIILTIGIVSVLVNRFLHKQPLELIRNADTISKITKISKLKLNRLGYDQAFRIKDILSNLGNNLVMLFGVFLCSLILITAFYLKDSVSGYSKDIVSDINYKTMYTLKGPLINEDFKGEKIFAKELYLAQSDNMAVTVYGINDEELFFNLKSKEHLNEVGSIAVSKGVALKAGLKLGDQITLMDKLTGNIYDFTIISLEDYNVGQSLFISLDTMNEMYDTKDYYNLILSDSILDIDENFILNKQTKEEIENSISDLISMLTSMSSILIIVAIALFILVMYLTVKISIQNSENNISYLKILGYRKNEINKMYLRGNIAFVIAGWLLALPCAAIISDQFFSMIMGSLSGYIISKIDILSIVFSFILAIISYISSSALIRRMIQNINLSQILKERV